MITGPDASAGSGASGTLDEAAEVLTGFEGVPLDAEAERAIAAALEACAERARAADAAYDQGGEAAADAAEADPGQTFFRSTDPYRGELLPPNKIEEFVPFIEDEPHWTLAGAEKPEALVLFEEEMRAKRPIEAKGGEGS